MFWNTATRWVAVKLNSVTSFVPPPPRAPDDTEPRRILLVHAHPVSDSLSSALADAVVAGAKDGGHEIRRRSLYQEGYRPELTAKERSSYFDSIKGAARCSSDVKRHLQDLRWANSLILVCTRRRARRAHVRIAGLTCPCHTLGRPNVVVQHAGDAQGLL